MVVWQSAAFDFVKLSFQTLMLIVYLRRGLPSPLIYFYLALLQCSWLISHYRFRRPWIDRDQVVARCFHL